MNNTEDAVNCGKLKRFRLISNCLCYGPCPEPDTEADTEAEQHLTITTDGRIWFSKYCFNNGIRYKRTFLERLHIASNVADPLVNRLAEFFDDGYVENFVTDCGDWYLEIIAEGGQRKYHGPLIPSLCPFLNQVSHQIRETLGREDILAFDGTIRKGRSI